MGFQHVKGQMLVLLVAGWSMAAAEQCLGCARFGLSLLHLQPREAAGWVSVDVWNHFPLGLWFCCWVGLIQQIVRETYNWKKAKIYTMGMEPTQRGMAGDRRHFLLCLGRSAGLVLFPCTSGPPGSLDCFFVRDLGTV